MSRPFARTLAAATLIAPAAALAQTTAPAPAAAATSADAPKAKFDQPADAKPIQSVEVKGTAADYDPRRDDTASKTVLNAEEIRKYGDDNIYDVLKRAPGVTVTGKTLRMRGLGVGYTQILVNGDRPPPGFSLDNLAPDQIERIEIIRAASAEYSMQAIAGTINIVLRKIVAKPQHDLRLNWTRSPLSSGGNVNGTWADKKGDLSYFINGFVYSGHNWSTSTGDEEFFAPSGELTQARTSVYENNGDYHGAVLFPRISWKIDANNDLNLSAGVQEGHNEAHGSGHKDDLVGTWPQPDWIDTLSRTAGTQRSTTADANWVAKIGGGKLDATLSLQASRNDNVNDGDYFTAGQAEHLVRDWDTTSHARRTSLRVKFTRTLFDGHALATGIDTSRQHQDDVRVRDEQQDAAAPVHIVEDFAPAIVRFAAFAQDEWNVTKQWSMYLGARWEGVRTDSAATGVDDTHSRSHVLSPVAQTLYKFPDNSGSQLRLALTRTYKAPTIDQLTARRNLSALNTRFTPDSAGNPALQPELATGIDAAYEHYWKDGAMVSVSGARRNIGDYIRTRLDLDADGRWVYRPLNDGSARVETLEAELKLPMRAVAAAWSGVDLRASVARNWSSVASVPGPDNRLDGQTPLSATFGVDWRHGGVTTGASLAYQKGGWVRVSDEQATLQQGRRDLDAYLLWKLDARFQLRLTLANILRQGYAGNTVYTDASGVSRDASNVHGVVRTGLNLEMKL